MMEPPNTVLNVQGASLLVFTLVVLLLNVFILPLMFVKHPSLLVPPVRSSRITVPLVSRSITLNVTTLAPAPPFLTPINTPA